MTEVSFRTDMGVQLIQASGDEQTIVMAARVSTLGSHTEPAEAAGLIRYLVREGHTSPLEHTSLTFRFEVPIFISRQIIRHRIASINEESGRYRELEPVFYTLPDGRPISQIGKTGDYVFTHDEELVRYKRRKQIKSAMFWWDEYQDDLAHGVAKEVARMETPLHLYSTLYKTANLHSWLNFVKKRTLRYGQKPQFEVAMVGEAVRDVLVQRFPVVMETFDHSFGVE